MSIVGLLNYIAKQTRFDIATITSILSQFLQHADQSMMDIALRVLVLAGVRRNRVLEGLSHPEHFVRIRRCITCTFRSYRRSAPPVTIWNHACAERSCGQLDFEMPDQHHAFDMRGRIDLVESSVPRNHLGS